MVYICPTCETETCVPKCPDCMDVETSVEFLSGIHDDSIKDLSPINPFGTFIASSLFTTSFSTSPQSPLFCSSTFTAPTPSAPQSDKEDNHFPKPFLQDSIFK